MSKSALSWSQGDGDEDDDVPIKRSGKKPKRVVSDDEEEDDKKGQMCKMVHLPLRGATLENVKMAAFLCEIGFENDLSLPPNTREVVLARTGPLGRMGMFALVREVALMMEDARRRGDRETVADLLGCAEDMLRRVLKGRYHYKYATALQAIAGSSESCVLDRALAVIGHETREIRTRIAIPRGEVRVPFTHSVAPPDGEAGDAMDSDPPAPPRRRIPVDASPVVRSALARGHSTIQDFAALAALSRRAPSFGPSTPMAIRTLKEVHADVRREVPDPVTYDALEPSVQETIKILHTDRRLSTALSMFTSTDFAMLKRDYNNGVAPTGDSRFVYNGINEIIARMPPLEKPIVVYRGISAVTLIPLNEYAISTSLSYEAAYNFTGASARKVIMNEIFVPTGCRVLPTLEFSSFKTEEEVTLGHGTTTVEATERSYFVPDCDCVVRTICIPPGWGASEIRRAEEEWKQYRDRTPIGWFVKRYPEYEKIDNANQITMCEAEFKGALTRGRVNEGWFF